ncbi:MAG: ABC transporter permease subunit [Candidatus Omnitrophica bacterium]|nr:ABC transporter permease subunit [Candidatus Omnitrophota bacterium]
MRNIFIIAANTFREALRNKLLNVLLLFAVIAIASTRFFTIFAPSEEMKIMLDTSLGIIRFIGMLITVFVTGGLLPREMSTLTITTILSKPVSRTQFLLGKFCGALYSIFANMAIMIVILSAILFLKFGAVNPEIFKAFVLIAAEFVVLCAITICLSTVSSEMFSVIFGILIYVIGHLTNYIQYLADRFDSFAMKSLLLSLYTLLPNFENFNIQNAVVLGANVSLQYMGKALVYGAIYTAVMLIIGYLFFAEREV